jgi:plasmid stability protein
MAQVIIRKLDDESSTGSRAGAKHRSLEQELREILTTAARPDLAEFRDFTAAMRARYAGISQTDSVELLREDGER